MANRITLDQVIELVRDNPKICAEPTKAERAKIQKMLDSLPEPVEDCFPSRIVRNEITNQGASL